MNRHSALRALYLACMLAVSAGAAHADIVKCVDQTGSVTLTDVPCENGIVIARTEPVTADTENALATAAVESVDVASVLAPAISRIAPARAIAAAANSREPARVKRPALTRPFSLDAAMLKAARSSMVMMDEASHQQKLASLR